MLERTKRMTVSCYAEGRDDKWEAVCLNFDIAVQGSSFQEVYESIGVAIDEYVAYVETLPAEEHAAFLSRRAPLSLRIKFLWHAFRITFFRRRGDGDKGRAEFLLPCSA